MKKKTLHPPFIFNNPRSRQGSLPATFYREVHLIPIFDFSSSHKYGRAKIKEEKQGPHGPQKLSSLKSIKIQNSQPIPGFSLLQTIRNGFLIKF